jgi:hypothetical protein
MKKKFRWVIYLPLLLYIIVFTLPFFRAETFTNGHFLSLSMLLIPSLGFPVFLLFILEFVIISLFVFLSTISFTIKPGKIKKTEEKTAALIIAGGYILWTIPTIIYSLTCSGKFCGIMFILAEPEAILFFNVQEMDKILGILLHVFLILTNAYLIYTFSKKGISYIAKKLSK